MVERIAARYPNVRLADAPGRHAGAWSEVARRIRLGLDYLRFLDPRYADDAASAASARASAHRALVVRLVELASGSAARRPARARRAAAWLERGLPGARELETFIARAGARRRADHAARGHRLAAARSLRGGAGAAACAPCCRSGAGITCRARRCCATMPRCASSCGTSRRSRSDRHARRAGRSRDRHRRAVLRPVVRPRAVASRRGVLPSVGLRPDRPFVLYVCSSLFRGTASEPAFVERVDSGGAQQRRSPAEGHRHPRSAASRAAGRVARRGSVRLSQRRVLGRASRWMPRRRRTTSIRCTTAPRWSA